MIDYIKRAFIWILLSIRSFFLYLSIAMFNTEYDILRANPNNLKRGDNKHQRKLHSNPTIEKFYAGQRDEKYVEDYYEILKKADNFLKKSTPKQIEMASHMNNTNFGMKDEYGRRYEHYGFFDPTHKHAKKKLEEVLEMEYEDRRTKDDDYPLKYIFNNTPIPYTLSKIFDVVDENNNVLDREEQSKTLQFPIKCHREDENIINKIEQLSEFLHVKAIGGEMVILEFFIPIKYNTNKIENDSKIFYEISNINSIFVEDDYGKLIGFKIDKFRKRIDFKDTYEVWKFNGTEMINSN